MEHNVSGSKWDEPGQELRTRFIIDAKTPDKSRRFGHLDWSPDGKYIASEFGTGNLAVWGAASSDLTCLWKGSGVPVTSIAWDPAAKYIAIGLYDGKVIVWQPFSNAIVAETSESDKHSVSVTGVVWDPVNYRPITGGQDIRVWGGCDTWFDSGILRSLSITSTHDLTVSALILMQNRQLAAATADGLLLGTLDSELTNQPIFLPGQGAPTALAEVYNPYRRLLACGDSRGSMHLIDPQTREVVVSKGSYDDEIAALDASSNGTALVSKDVKGRVLIWKTDPLEAVYNIDEYDTDSSIVRSRMIAFDPTSPQFAVLCNGRRMIRVVDLNTQAIAGKRKRHVSSEPILKSGHFVPAP